MTNAEKIRQMTDEELAEWLCEITEDCPACIASKYCRRGHTGTFDWVKQEWEEDHED